MKTLYLLEVRLREAELPDDCTITYPTGEVWRYERLVELDNEDVVRSYLDDATHEIFKEFTHGEA